MGEFSGIEWTHHTFNPWIGCTKVSPACDHCYAEMWDKRYEGGQHWGPKAPRRRTSPANWRKPLQWDKKAAEAGVRHRVFCASLADVFDNKVPDEWRADLFDLIHATPNLDWLLLTKRPQNIAKMLPPFQRPPGQLGAPVPAWGMGWPNVWLGTTVENQEEAQRRILPLLNVPAALRFLSCEPLLGPLDLTKIATGLAHIGGPDEINALSGYQHKNYNATDSATEFGNKLDWIITGGESGPDYRPADPNWFRSLRDQCAEEGTAFLFKQWEGKTTSDIKLKGRKLDGVLHNGYPKSVA